MPCSIKERILLDINTILTENHKTVSMINNRAYIFWDKESKIKTEDQAREFGKRLINKINSKYKAQLYGNLISFANDAPKTGSIGLFINIPQSLITAYEDKEAKQNEIKDNLESSKTENSNTIDFQEEQPINKEIVTKTYDKKWKDGSNTNKATSFALKNKPNEIFELVNDKEEGFYSLHIKTTNKNALTEEEKQQLVKAVANSIPVGGKLSSWGEATKGGLSGLNRFKNEGFVEVDNRKVSDNQTIPILEKKPINKEIKPNEVIKFFETKFNLPVEYDNTLSSNIGGYVKDDKVYLNPNINPDKLEEVLIEEYTHVITTKLEKEHPEIFEGLFQDLINTPEYKEIRGKAIAKVNSLYPELTTQEVEKLLNKGIEQQNQVNYVLKSANILQSKEGQDIWNKGVKNNWSLDKIFTEMRIPKEQITLLKDIHHNILNKGRLGILTPQELLKELYTDLLVNYNYIVEINTAKSKTHSTSVSMDTNIPAFSVGGVEYFYDEEAPKDYSGYFKRINDEDEIEITQKEYDKQYKKFKENEKQELPTQHYSNLTVPGGTNYIESEIAIPDVSYSTLEIDNMINAKIRELESNGDLKIDCNG